MAISVITCTMCVPRWPVFPPAGSAAQVHAQLPEEGHTRALLLRQHEAL